MKSKEFEQEEPYENFEKFCWFVDSRKFIQLHFF